MEKLSGVEIVLATMACVASLGMMVVVQIPTPDYLNPVGCLFGISFMFSGMYAIMGMLFMWK